MQSTNYAYVNGRFVPENEATVSIFNRGFLYGDGVFETMRIYDGRIFRVREHLQRLMNGLLVLRLEMDQETNLDAIFTELLDRNKLRNGIARVYVTSGQSDLERRTDEDGRLSVVVTAQPPQPAITELRAMTSTIRIDEKSIFARLKTANRLPYVLARAQAMQAGFEEALLLNEHSHVAELSVSNIFLVKNGSLWTPSLVDGILPCINLDVVL